MWVPYGRPIYCVLHRREAHRERIYRYLRGVRTEGPDNAFYIDDKHTMDVYVVICVVSVQRAPALCFTSAISTPWTNWSLFVWVSHGRPRYCILPRRKAHSERIYRCLRVFIARRPRYCVLPRREAHTERIYCYLKGIPHLKAR